MIRAALLTLLLCLAVRCIVPDAEAADLSYRFYVLGVPVGDAVLSIDLAAPAYRVGLRFHTTGLVDVVASDWLNARARGVFSGGPAPLEYVSNSRLHGQDRVVSMVWRDGLPAVTAIAPPNTGEREDVPAQWRARAIDPLSSIAQLVHQAATTGRCDGSVRSFDGRRLQEFNSRTVGEEDLAPSRHSDFSGRGLRCDFTDRVLAGYRLGSGRDDDMRPRRGTIWLAPLHPGDQRVPVRASVETLWLGDAMVYLTAPAQ
jgi:hypothetical protein